MGGNGMALTGRTLPTRWTLKDGAQTQIDIDLLNERFFFVDDGFIYKVADFLMIQEPGTERMEYPDRREGEATLSYATIVPGQKRWYIVLAREDDPDEKAGLRYDEVMSSSDWHRVRSKAEPKTVYRPRGPDLGPRDESNG